MFQAWLQFKRTILISTPFNLSNYVQCFHFWFVVLTAAPSKDLFLNVQREEEEEEDDIGFGLFDSYVEWHACLQMPKKKTSS